MSFYRVPLFFVFFGTWAVVGLAEKPKEDELTAARRTITEKTTFPINLLPKIASRTRALAQSFRRLLKMIRKWWRSHPPEVKLGRCFANYFNIKIPEWRRYEQLDGYNDNPKKTKSEAGRLRDPFEKTARPLKAEDDSTSGTNNARQISFLKKSFFFKFLEKSFAFIRDGLNAIFGKFQIYREIFDRNQLLVCLWDYFLKKFWTWVDSAPDS